MMEAYLHEPIVEQHMQVPPTLLDLAIRVTATAHRNAWLELTDYAQRVEFTVGGLLNDGTTKKTQQFVIRKCGQSLLRRAVEEKRAASALLHLVEARLRQLEVERDRHDRDDDTEMLIRTEEQMDHLVSLARREH